MAVAGTKAKAKTGHEALVIDSEKRQVRRATFVSVKDIRDLIGCGQDGFCVGWHWSNGEVLYVDDAGLLKPTLKHYFRIKDRIDGQPYAGNGLIVGREISDVEGNMVRHDRISFTIAGVERMIEWLTRSDFVRWVISQGDTPSQVARFLDDPDPIAMSHWVDYITPEERARGW
jgi:hypothetical protein